MKKLVQSLLLSFIAVTVFFTGAGVTIMNYCCTSCGRQILFVTEQQTCCTQAIEIKEESKGCCASDNTVSHKACETASYKSDAHCYASRLSIDTDIATHRPHIATPFIWVSDIPAGLVSSILPDRIGDTNEYIKFKSRPDIPPREYLSLLRVLII